MQEEIRRYLIAVDDDDDADVFLIREALAEQSLVHEFRRFRGSAQTLAFLTTLDANPALPCPDIFLVDDSASRHPGLEVIRRIRASARCAPVPVIIMTASDFPADRTRAAQAGATAFFFKPLELDQFLGVGGLVRNLLRGKTLTAGG